MNPKFIRRTALLLLVGLFLMFFYVGLQIDHLNVLTPYLQTHYGWTDLAITNPVTAAAIVSIPLYLVTGAAFDRFGLRRVLLPALGLLALACVGLASFDQSYAVFAVSLFTVRLMVIPLLLGTFLMCANWFIAYRGRVLGIVTAGAPLFSIVGIASMNYIANTMGLGLSVYAVIAGIVVTLMLITAFGLRDTPEELGLYPDGRDHKPRSESGPPDAPISVRQLLGDRRAWQLIVSYGILQFVIVAMMAYMAVRFISLSTPGDEPNLFVSRALPWLSIGAAAGIPMSYVLGWIDDRVGSINASLVLNGLFFCAVIPLALMPPGGSAPLLALWAFGVACMTGGVPTLHPSIASHVYGRRQFMAANKWIMMVQAIPMAFAVAFMAAFNRAGELTTAYYALIGLLVVAFLTLLGMRGIPDANAADRRFGSNDSTAPAARPQENGAS